MNEAQRAEVGLPDHSPQISTELLTCEALGVERLHEVQCADCQTCTLENKVMRADLEAFCARVLGRYGVPPGEAATTARVLVSADLRGIASHGVARLGRYIKGLKAGYIRPGVEFGLEEPVPAIGVVDARNGIGQVVSEWAMDLAIRKARDNGVGVVTVKNSNHFGIAGYYVQKAIDANMLGVCMTNAAPLVVPTNGAEAVLGTNPIAVGAPGGDLPFLLDMATSVVPRGKLEVADRNRKQIPVGWAVDEKGFDSHNPGQVLGNMLARTGGGILPLGGRGEMFSGYKGYGLALLVDVLCGVLSGSAFGFDVDNLEKPAGSKATAAPRVGHFFMAMDIARFMPVDEFTQRLDALFSMLKGSKKALDQAVIYVHGEKEHIRSLLHERGGIPITENVFDSLRRIAEESGTEPPTTVADHLRRQARTEDFS
jgi:LDH2 family malate/lactate/ureidoglycolate dehydrogenase